MGPAKSESESGCRAEAVAPARWIESSSVDRSSVESSQWRESKTSESASARLSHQVTSECSRLLHIFCILIAVNPSLQSLAVNPSLQSLRPPAADTAAPRRPTVTHRPVTVMGLPTGTAGLKSQVSITMESASRTIPLVLDISSCRGAAAAPPPLRRLSAAAMPPSVARPSAGGCSGRLLAAGSRTGES